MDPTDIDLQRFEDDGNPVVDKPPPRPYPASLYVDGGIVGKNPSPMGGTWAFCTTDAQDRFIAGAHGAIRPEWAGMETIENNLSELVAAVFGLEAMPDGWAGTLYTDSLNTLRRVNPVGKPTKWNGVPEELQIRATAVKQRLGLYKCHLLGGHPSELDLRRGKRGDGKAVSRWNVWCDERCQEEARKFPREAKKASA